MSSRGAVNTSVYPIENLAQLAAPVSFSDPDVTEHELISALVPGSTLGGGGRGRISALVNGRLDINNNAGGNITLRVRMGHQADALTARPVLGTDVMDVNALFLAIDTYWYTLRIDVSARSIGAIDAITGELSALFNAPQGIQAPTNIVAGVRQLFTVAVATEATHVFSVTAQFDAGVDALWSTDYAHVDRIRCSA